MNFIKNIISFLKKKIRKTESTKVLTSGENANLEEDKIQFINSLRIDISKEINKKKIETLTCNGDGLGIQDEMEG